MSTGTSLVAKKPLRQITDVRELFVNDNARQQLQAVAAHHMRPERMMRLMANACRTTPQLYDCEPLTLLGALMQCASLGLEPNTVLGHAYLIPFKNNKKGITEVQLIVGYKGFIDMARRTDQVVSVHADVVYDDDEEWSYRYGSNMHLDHRPGPRRGKPTHAYCHVKLVNGEGFRVLQWDDVLRIRDQYSQGWRNAVRLGKQKDHPWHKHLDAMARKTAVRALASAGEMPMSVEFADAMEVDERSADFAGFALDPSAGGVTIDGEATEAGGETVDQETGEIIDASDGRSEINTPAAKEQEQKPRARKAPPDGDQQPGKKASGKRSAEPYAEQKQEGKIDAKDDAKDHGGAQGAVGPESEGTAGEDAAAAADEIPEEYQSLLAKVRLDLDQAGSAAEIDEMIAEYHAHEIEETRDACPAAFHLIHQAIAEAHDRVSGAGQ